MKNIDRPAYPTKMVSESDGSRNSIPDNVNGLTKQEYVATELAKVFSPPKFCVGDEVTQENIDNWSDKIVRLSNELLNKLDENGQD